jgi:hypothetical protein
MKAFEERASRRVVSLGCGLAILALVGCGSVDPFPEAPGDAQPAEVASDGDFDAGDADDADGTLPDAPGDGAIVRDAPPTEPLPDATWPDTRGADGPLPDVVTVPDACPPPPEPPHPCDQITQTGCPAGQACTTYAVTSPGDPACGTLMWGTQCQAAGTAKQWEACSGTGGCAAGYECWGLRGALVCMKLCDATTGEGCDPGLACDALFLGSNAGLCE